MKEKLMSRKFWMTIAGLLSVIATEIFGADQGVVDSVTRAIEIIVPVYVGSQGLVDFGVDLLKKIG